MLLLVLLMLAYVLPCFVTVDRLGAVVIGTIPVFRVPVIHWRKGAWLKNLTLVRAASGWIESLVSFSIELTGRKVSRGAITEPFVHYVIRKKEPCSAQDNSMLQHKRPHLAINDY